MRKILIAVAAIAAALSPSLVSAATDTSDMPITAIVINNCTVTASPMVFGTLTGVGASNIDSSATIALVCTPDAAYDVSLDLGLNAGAGTQRELVNGADATQRIPYDLYQDASRTTPWGTGAGNTVSGTAALGVATLTAYGRIPTTATSVTAGAYSDSVTVTVTF